MMPMDPDRYSAKDTARALTILGFTVRDPDGGRVMYCFHGRTKAEFWIPKEGEYVLEDVLERILDGLPLPIDFFKSVYSGLKDDNKYPSDQY